MINNTTSGDLCRDKKALETGLPASYLEDNRLLLQDNNYEGWNDQHKNVPGTIVRKMGLRTKMLPLHNCLKNKSQLFFKKGTVTVDTDQKDENFAGFWLRTH